MRRNVEVDKHIYYRYSYRIRQVRENSLLFFEANHARNNDSIQNYEFRMRQIIQQLLDHGYNIYIKPHPRMWYSRFLDEYDVTILPDYVPGEFVDLEPFSAVIGIETVAIAKIAKYRKIPVFSVLELFDFRNRTSSEQYKEFLMDQSKGNLTFISTKEQLTSAIKNIST